MLDHVELMSGIARHLTIMNSTIIRNHPHTATTPANTNEKKRLTVSLTSESIKSLESQCQADEATQSEIVRQAILMRELFTNAWKNNSQVLIRNESGEIERIRLIY